jgi:hypothetical protein
MPAETKSTPDKCFRRNAEKTGRRELKLASPESGFCEVGSGYILKRSSFSGMIL